jgi:hypothetical protein
MLLRSTLPLVAPTLADLTASTAMVGVHHNVRAHPAARRALHARERQLNILMDLIRRLVVKFCTKDLLQIHPLKLNRLGLFTASHDSETEYVPSCPAATNGPYPIIPLTSDSVPPTISSTPSGSVSTAVNITDSPAVIFETFVCRLRNTGAPATGAVEAESLVGGISLELSDSPGPVVTVPALGLMVAGIEVMVSVA